MAAAEEAGGDLIEDFLYFESAEIICEKNRVSRWAPTGVLKTYG